MKHAKTIALSASIPALLALLLIAGPSVGQQEKGDTPPPAKTKVETRVSGRLPAYFAAVVTQAQREQIYSIQSKANTEIRQLQKQIDDLRAQLTKEVDAVLTAEQLASVNKRREAARSRQSSRNRPATGNSPPPGNSPGSGS